MINSLSEAVDLPSLVLSAMEEFVNSKSKKVGVTDKRWACGLLVQALFPEGNSGKEGLPWFKRSVMEGAVKVLEEWKLLIDGSESGGGASLGVAEALTFVQMVVGFRLIREFDEEFLKIDDGKRIEKGHGKARSSIGR